MRSSTFLRFFTLLSFLAFTQMACTKDRTGEGDGNDDDQPTGLAADLDGSFEVQYIDFGGTLTNPVTTAPIDSAGNGVEQGTFTFNASENTAQYDVVGRIQTSFLGQSVDLPLPVQGSGDLIVESNTRFIIDDAERGKSTFDVSNNTGDAMLVSTKVKRDTSVMAFDVTLDMTMDIKLKRK